MTYNVFPTGTTIYDPENCWNGYTIWHRDIKSLRDFVSQGGIERFPYSNRRSQRFDRPIWQCNKSHLQSVGCPRHRQQLLKRIADATERRRRGAAPMSR